NEKRAHHGSRCHECARAPCDARALQKPSGTDRIASTWYGGTITADLAITDGQTHQVSLYVLDCDRANRTQTVQVLDAATQAVLGSEERRGGREGGDRGGLRPDL